MIRFLRDGSYEVFSGTTYFKDAIPKVDTYRLQRWFKYREDVVPWGSSRCDVGLKRHERLRKRLGITIRSASVPFAHVGAAFPARARFKFRDQRTLHQAPPAFSAFPYVTRKGPRAAPPLVKNRVSASARIAARVTLYSFAVVLNSS